MSDLPEISGSMAVTDAPDTAAFKAFLMFLPHEYYEKMVLPSVEEFRNRPGDIKLAFQACIATVHIIDYIEQNKTVDPKKGECETKNTMKLHCEASADFKLIRDFGFAAKHCRLTKTKTHSGMYVEMGGGIRVGDQGIDLLAALNATLAFLEGLYPQLRRP